MVERKKNIALFHLIRSCMNLFKPSFCETLNLNEIQSIWTLIRAQCVFCFLSAFCLFQDHFHWPNHAIHLFILPMINLFFTDSVQTSDITFFNCSFCNVHMYNNLMALLHLVYSLIAYKWTEKLGYLLLASVIYFTFYLSTFCDIF